MSILITLAKFGFDIFLLKITKYQRKKELKTTFSMKNHQFSMKSDLFSMKDKLYFEII